MNNSIQFVYFLGDLIIYSKEDLYLSTVQHNIFEAKKMGYVLTKVDIIKSGEQLFCIFLFS